MNAADESGGVLSGGRLIRTMARGSSPLLPVPGVRARVEARLLRVLARVPEMYAAYPLDPVHPPLPRLGLALGIPLVLDNKNKKKNRRKIKEG